MKLLLTILFGLNLAFALDLLRLGELRDQNVSGWLASEKLDGVRAYWDGHNLLSRNGKILAAPSEFTARFPPFAMDGELFIGRGKFEKTQSIVMDERPDMAAWRAVKFHVFDVPEAVGSLMERLQKLREFLRAKPNEKIVIIRQHKIAGRAELDVFLEQVIVAGGEGVVVRDPVAPYERRRSEKALKYKRFHDAECKVVAINKGSGKYANLMGSITCEAIGETADLSVQERSILAGGTQNLDAKIPRGTRFKIGSGFSDELRANPPKIGQVVTYKFQNLTAKGKPRFPIFLRVRED